jgi:Tfp pilus assembly protein PilN
MKTVMPPLWLDYLRPIPGRQWPGLVVLIVSLLISIGLFVHFNKLSRQLTKIEQQVSRLKQQEERRRMLARADEQGRDEVRQQPASPLDLRWESLLVALEKAIDDSVTLLGLEPGVRDIAIAGEAKDLNALLDYLKRLQAASVFVDLHLTKHEIIQLGAVRTVRFSLQASWREGAR